MNGSAGWIGPARPLYVALDPPNKSGALPNLAPHTASYLGSLLHRVFVIFGLDGLGTQKAVDPI